MCKHPSNNSCIGLFVCGVFFMIDIQELKVFVDLAMISAGESDMDVDRVSCFHRAATGYAPFIFELKGNVGYKKLLAMTQKVWKAMEMDNDLPKKLVGSMCIFFIL